MIQLRSLSAMLQQTTNEDLFESHIGTLMDEIHTQINELVKNECSLKLDELIEQKNDPLMNVIPTLPLTFNGKKWAELVRLAKPSFSSKLSDEMRMLVTDLMNANSAKATTGKKKISNNFNPNQSTTSSNAPISQTGCLLMVFHHILLLCLF